MLCGGCGYENPVSLARCPRCGLSEDTIVARSLAAASAAVAAAEKFEDRTEPEPVPVPAPIESLTLATKVTSTRRNDAFSGTVPIAEMRARGPRRARADADWIPVAVIGGAIIAFLIGTMLGISLLPSRATSAPTPAPLSMMPG